MKKLRYLIISLTAVLVCMSSCEDELEQVNPNAITTGSFWKTADDFDKGLNAVYSALQFPSVSGSEITKNMLRSDLAGTESWYGNHLQYTNLTWNDASDFVSTRWSQLYIGIFRANQVLDNIKNEGITGLTEEERVLIEAQARFVRGINYFWLGYSYNGAVIHDEVAISDDDLKKPFSNLNEVITTMVIPDLEFAYNNLPKTWDDSQDLGRVTWGAAAAMLGKTYLYNKEWDKAANYFKQVIDEGIYRLTTDYMENFTLEGEFNSESIFEVVFSDNYKAGAGGNNHDDVHGNPGSEATSIASNFASIVGAGGYNSCMPSYWLQELFVSGDSIDVSNPDNFGKRYSSRTFASIVVEFGDGEYYNAPLTTDPITGEKSKANFNYGQGSKVKKWTNWYWADSEDAATGARGGINFRHIRLADVYLMYAEAILERDGDGAVNEAMTYIDMLRERAGVITLQRYREIHGGQIPQLHVSKFANGLSEFPLTAVNKDALMTHLRMVERPLELAFEGHRWYDLVRWGIVKNIFDERRAEEVKIEQQLGNPIPATQPKIYPLFLNERVRLDFVVPAANYSSAIHDYFPIPSIEVQSNNNLN
ncbi:RagB/SusD family nutrient uptake outer membrane protein [Flexithrix dorotheae]|uniref:RagB/SusD family nutrient uptake outer membrane protein n=1 Tax=Flexithrix dorotheae TaxID=70993 RepID=UPI0004754942|nr:RagB/SusD family nutrient uptake outer membrane protein [Flexithrix dorotheae]